MAKHSIAGAARRAKAEDKKMRAEAKKTPTADSFVNFAQKLGVGADNALSTASYGFNPITRVRIVLEWMHRGSWLAGQAVDVVADDMTRAGVEIESEIPPDDIKQIEEEIVRLNVWGALNDNIKWSRLYGGSLAVLLIDGQDTKTPFRIETVGKGQFKGLAVLDRWMLEPSMNDLVTEYGPSMGLPKFYRVGTDAPALAGKTIHYSRCIRLEGIRLPYYQRVQENLWSISVLERLYDRMIAFDSASTGAAQLVYKAYLRTYKIKDMRQIVGTGGKALSALVAYVEMMRRFQGIEGITLMDAEDEFEGKEQNSFQGLANILDSFGEQLSGSLQIPLVRLFGQSPRGFNNGDSDLHNYYDGIKQKQEGGLRVPVTLIYRATAQSLGVEVPPGFWLNFRNLWQLTDVEKAGIADTVTRAVVQAEEAGVISQQVAMKELKQSSRVHGLYSNITDEDIEAAEESLPPAGEHALGMVGGAAIGEDVAEGEKEQAEAAAKAKPAPAPGGAPAAKPAAADAKRRRKARDDSGLVATTEIKKYHNLDVVMETKEGEHRRGRNFDVILPYDYGYIRRAGDGGDGEALDCIIGRDHQSTKVFIINQVDPITGEPDEYKVLLGYGDLKSALTDYLAGYDDGLGWERIGGQRALSMDQFKAWIKERT